MNTKTVYYQNNKQIMLNRSKEYYENNKKDYKSKQKINIENYPTIKRKQKRIWKK